MGCRLVERYKLNVKCICSSFKGFPIPGNCDIRPNAKSDNNTSREESEPSHSIHYTYMTKPWRKRNPHNKEGISTKPFEKPMSLVLRHPVDSAPTSFRPLPGKFRIHYLSQKKFQEISCMNIVSRKEFPMLNGVFTQSDFSREYVGFSMSARDVDQVDKIDMCASDSLK